MFTPVDLSASGLELVETTHKSDAASAYAEPPAPAAPRRPRRERPAAPPPAAAEPLEQVETRREEDSAAH
ncbi:MAG TPA: hypothetical protein VF859_10740 [Burkholderiales bacterium]